MEGTVTRLLDSEGENTPLERRLELASCWLGLAAPLVALGAIFAAVLLSPSFDWGINALSDLGRADVVVAETPSALADPRPAGVSAAAATETTRLVFNTGLILGAVLGLGFGFALFRAADHAVELLGIGLLGLTLVLMGLIGVFSWPYALHLPVAAGFFTVLSGALMVYGTGNYLAGHRTRGAATAVAGGAHVLMWIGWILAGGVPSGGVARSTLADIVMRPGLAYPEIVGAGLLAVWAVWTALAVRRDLGHGGFGPA